MAKAPQPKPLPQFLCAKMAPLLEASPLLRNRHAAAPRRFLVTAVELADGLLRGGDSACCVAASTGSAEQSRILPWQRRKSLRGLSGTSSRSHNGPEGLVRTSTAQACSVPWAWVALLEGVAAVPKRQDSCGLREGLLERIDSLQQDLVAKAVERSITSAVAQTRAVLRLLGCVGAPWNHGAHGSHVTECERLATDLDSSCSGNRSGPAALEGIVLLVARLRQLVNARLPPPSLLSQPMSVSSLRGALLACALGADASTFLVSTAGLVEQAAARLPAGHPGKMHDGTSPANSQSESCPSGFSSQDAHALLARFGHGHGHGQAPLPPTSSIVLESSTAEVSSLSTCASPVSKSALEASVDTSRFSTPSCMPASGCVEESILPGVKQEGCSPDEVISESRSLRAVPRQEGSEGDETAHLAREWLKLRGISVAQALGSEQVPCAQAVEAAEASGAKASNLHVCLRGSSSSPALFTQASNVGVDEKVSRLFSSTLEHHPAISSAAVAASVPSTWTLGAVTAGRSVADTAKHATRTATGASARKPSPVPHVQASTSYQSFGQARRLEALEDRLKARLRACGGSVPTPRAVRRAQVRVSSSAGKPLLNLPVKPSAETREELLRRRDMRIQRFVEKLSLEQQLAEVGRATPCQAAANTKSSQGQHLEPMGGHTEARYASISLLGESGGSVIHECEPRPCPPPEPCPALQ